MTIDGASTRDVARCKEHGFALSPEGRCVRCARFSREAGVAGTSRRATQIAAAGFVLLAAALGARAAIAHATSADAPSLAEIRDTFPFVASVAGAAVLHEQGGNWAPLDEEAEEPEPGEPAEATSLPLPSDGPDDWDRAMARAEAERRAERAAKAANEKQALADALKVEPTAGATLTGASRAPSGPCHRRPATRPSQGFHRPARRVPIDRGAWSGVLGGIAARGDRASAASDCRPCVD